MSDYNTTGDNTGGTSAEQPVELSIVIPTRNEQGNIRSLLDRLSNALSNQQFEVIFIDDSNDDTVATVQQARDAYSFPIELFHRPLENRDGLSGAVVAGLSLASGQWVCIMDGDLQHPPEEIQRMLAQAQRTGADIVVASRRADALGPQGLSRGRATTSQALTVMARAVFPRVLKNVSDPLTGFFLIRRSAVDATTLKPDGFKILMEILVRHPELHVTEIKFDFAPRNTGRSKADVQEGLRYFRHLATLRLTVNQHLVRFLGLLIAAVVLNLALLYVFTEQLGIQSLRAATLAYLATAVLVALGEIWVFSDRRAGQSAWRPFVVVVSAIAILLLVYLPAVTLLTRIGLPVLVAALPAMAAVGLVYYLLSEHWIWTRGLTMQDRPSYTYDLHSLLTIRSDVALADLEWFATPVDEAQADLVIRTDRHGTPTAVPGGISFDEQLSRFGFGLTLIPGNYTEMIVSPLLGDSPGFLYANVVEPVLAWMFIQRGYALIHAAAVAGSDEFEQRPVSLVTGRGQLAYGVGRLCTHYGLAFMGDDRALLGHDGNVLAFPKPVSANPEMMEQATAAAQATAPLILQRWLYSQTIRDLGLTLSRRGFPAATANTYLQRALPQPKYTLESLLPALRTESQGLLEQVMLLIGNQDAGATTAMDEAVDTLLGTDAAGTGFEPRPLLTENLKHWEGVDWTAEAEAIVRAALASATIASVTGGERWWEEAGQIIRSPQPREGQPPAVAQPAGTS